MSETKFKTCKHIEKLLKAEIKIIRDHIAEHKWFNHIADENKGIEDFIEKYGWIMREMYCGFACPDRLNCLMSEVLNIEEIKNEEDDQEQNLSND